MNLVSILYYKVGAKKPASHFQIPLEYAYSMGEPTHILREVSFGVNSFTVLSANINQSTKLAVLKKLPKNGYQGLRTQFG